MKKKIKISPFSIVLFAAAILFAIFAPRLGDDYSLMVLNVSLIYSIAVYGISIMLGMGGQMSFAAVSFMAVGAYFTANMCSNRLGFVMDTSLALLLSIILGGIAAYLIGMVLFKLKGSYFTFATIGLVQVSWSFFQNYRQLFGGPDGISNVKSLKIFGFTPSDYTQWFYLLIGLVLIVALLVERIRRTRLGRSLASIRDNETAALTLGVNTYQTKVIAFTIAGALAAMAGSLYSMHGHFVSSDMFTFERSTSYIIMAMLGGVNSTLGVFLGSVLITMLPEWLRSLQQYLQLIYGISIIVMMVFMPMGLAGLVKSIGSKIKQNNKKKHLKEVE
jgi:ABC-type branched-chain amino acid transport system, permease component